MKRESEEIFPISDNLSDRICNLRWKFYFKYNRGFCWPRKWFIQILLEWRVETKMCASFDTKNTFLMDNFSNYCLPSFGKLKIHTSSYSSFVAGKVFLFLSTCSRTFLLFFDLQLLLRGKKHKFCYYTL